MLPTRCAPISASRFSIGIESESQSPVAAQLRLYRDGTAVGGESIMLKPGMNRFELPYRIDQPGAYLMSAEVSIAPPRVALNSARRGRRFR